jgi:hypothetical protein
LIFQALFSHGNEELGRKGIPGQPPGAYPRKTTKRKIWDQPFFSDGGGAGMFANIEAKSSSDTVGGTSGG